MNLSRKLVFVAVIACALPTCVLGQVRDSGVTEVIGEPIDRPDPGPTRVDREAKEPKISTPVVPSAAAQPSSSELTIYQLAGTLDPEILRAADVNQLAVIAARWNAAMRKAAAGHPKSTAYLSDKDRAIEFLVDQSKGLIEDKALEALLPEVAQIIAKLPDWLPTAMIVIDVSAPSPTASDEYQAIELDKRMQTLIWERAEQLLPNDAHKVFDPLRKLELPVEGASIRSR